jgi:hypothetical protein
MDAHATLPFPVQTRAIDNSLDSSGLLRTSFDDKRYVAAVSTVPVIAIRFTNITRSLAFAVSNKFTIRTPID